MDKGVGEKLRQATQIVNLPDDPVERLKRRRNRKRRNERLSATAVSLVLVGALVGGSFAIVHGMHRGPAVLHPAAHGSLAGHQASHGSYTPVELQPGQYLYMRQTLTHNGQTFTTETWWATDGSGRQRITCSTQNCVMDQSSDGSYSDSYAGAGDHTYGAGQFPSDDDLSGLSTDPATLREQMIVRTAPGGKSPEPAFSPGPELTPGVTAGGLLDAILNVVQEPNGQPDVKAAAFQVATGIPGVNVRTGVTDAAGRPATALEFGLDGGAITDYYFDPQTNLLMGYGFEGSTDTIVYDQAIVGSTDAMPDASQWLFPPSSP